MHVDLLDQGLVEIHANQNVLVRSQNLALKLASTKPKCQKLGPGPDLPEEGLDGLVHVGGWT